MKKDKPPISAAEMEVLRVLWDHGPDTIRGVDAYLQPRQRWAYTTIQTLLNRLEGKGYVKCDRRNVPHVFSAALSREKLLGQRLSDLADQLCDGAATPLVAALVRHQRFSDSEIAAFRKLLDEADPRK